MDLVVLPPWIPEDDLLLKNSVEAGASLESLARGAVRFSRKYSITELRDRWRSLLYDPGVAAEAADSMANLELSGKSSGGGAVKEGAGAAYAKRKEGPSIRKQYYAMRKRLCRQVYESFHADNEKALSDAIAIAIADDSVVDDSKDRGLKGKCARDDVLNNNNDNNNNNSSNNASAAAVVLGGNDGVPSLSDSLSNLAKLAEEELVLMDVDGKDDRPCNENVVGSLLLSSPCQVQGNDASEICCESQKLDKGAKASSSPSHLCADSDTGNGALPSVSAQQQSPCRSGSNEECRNCSLNTEDPDIPSGDSADLPIVVPPLLTMKPQAIVKREVCSDSSVNNQRKKEPGGSSNKEDNAKHSPATSLQPQLVRSGLVHNVNSSQPTVGGGVVMKVENAGRKPISPVSKQTNNVNVQPSHSRLVHATVTPPAGHPKQKAKVCVHPSVEEHKHLPESEVKSLSHNQEGGGGSGDDDDDDNYDNEVPSFSDAEAMILEMDLCPADQDTNGSREVLRYQHAETKRTIMRLEQCAQSFMQRAIASRGAFAVLYGRNLKQYINKSKVVLGRGTDDMQVDIDLRREGCANNISRRQALIKMEANGSFIIKNLGKRSIYLNGKEIATGQLRGLNASCLIEIRGMSFIFETNKKSVRSFLENMDNKGEDKRKPFTMVA